MLNVLKCFSSIGAIIMLVVGLVFTGVTVYAFLNQDVLLSDQNIKHQILNGMIIVSSTVVVVSLLSIVGVVRKNCGLIFIYQIFLTVFLALFLAFGIISVIVPETIFNGNCRQSNNDLITSANKLYEKSNVYFCKSTCPCSLAKSSQENYTPQELSGYEFDSIKGVNSTQKCSDFKNWWTNTSAINFFDTVGQIEKFFQCSNWCPDTAKDNLFYRFSDVNNGRPRQTCYTALHDAFYHYARVVGVTCFIISAVFLLVCVCNICLCCHPNTRKLKFRDRFIYVSENTKGKNYRRI